MVNKCTLYNGRLHYANYSFTGHNEDKAEAKESSQNDTNHNDACMLFTGLAISSFYPYTKLHTMNVYFDETLIQRRFK